MGHPKHPTTAPKRDFARELIRNNHLYAERTLLMGRVCVWGGEAWVGAPPDIQLGTSRGMSDELPSYQWVSSMNPQAVGELGVSPSTSSCLVQLHPLPPKNTTGLKK